MKVRDLRAALEGLDDDLPVLLTAGDHGYTEAESATATDVGTLIGTLKHRRETRYCEWDGPENASPGETLARALVIV